MNLICRCAAIPFLAGMIAIVALRQMATPLAASLPSTVVVVLSDERCVSLKPEPMRPSTRCEDSFMIDIRKMIQVGLSEETIAAYARLAGFRPTAEELIELSRGGVSEGLLARLAGGSPQPPLPATPPSATPPQIEVAPPPPSTTIVISSTPVFPVTEVVVQDPPSGPERAENPVIEVVAFCPVHHRRDCSCARNGLSEWPKVRDTFFRTIPFLPNPVIPGPAANVAKASACRPGAH